jgi:hypothetical protein
LQQVITSPGSAPLHHSWSKLAGVAVMKPCGVRAG